MFTANTELQVSSLDFQSIKNNLKTFLKNKTEFADYDFEGSTINYLVDLLSYNTYMNSFYTNMAINETYLDTAQIRSSVVSNAKKLGYTPKSALASVASINIAFKPTGNVSQIKVPKKTKFVAKKDGKDFYFTTKDDFIITKTNNIFKKEIQIYEGQYFEQEFNYDSSRPFYPILEKNVDITSLVVRVQLNVTSSEIQTYALVDNIVDIDNTSKVFFLQENSEGRYEVYFGNGVLGEALSPGNVIKFEYFVTQGSLGNEIASFTNVGYSGHNLIDSSTQYIPSSITTTKRSSLGVDRETIDSIRFNAPNNYFSQNRLVTTTDFESYVLKNFPFVQSLNVWGGEDHWIPIYGKVILSIKPHDGFALPIEKKNEMISQMKSKNILAIDPLIIDPIFTFVKPTIRVTFNSTKTTNTPEEIFEAVRTKIVDYEEAQLSSFGKSFRHSTFVSLIDSADKSIVSNETEIVLEKRFVPIMGSTMTYKIQFDAGIKHPYAGALGALTSTGYKNNKTDNVLYVEDDGFGVIRSIYYENGNRNQKKIFEDNVGTINYDTGDVTLSSVHFVSIEDGGLELRIYVVPLYKDYTQTKNQILLLSEPQIILFDVKTNQISKAASITVEGNVSPILSTSVSGTSVSI